MPGDEVLITRDGDKLVIEPKSGKTLLEVLSELEPLGEEDQFPDIDDDHMPQREIDL